MNAVHTDFNKTTDAFFFLLITVGCCGLHNAVPDSAAGLANAMHENTNAGTGTAEEMSNWVEYRNLHWEGKYAKRRIANGFEESRKVKY